MGDYIVYLAGATLVVVALFRGRRSGHSIKARDISASILVNGDNSGSIVQSPSPAASDAKSKGTPDRVSWAIGLAGVAIAAVQLVVDLVKK